MKNMFRLSIVTVLLVAVSAFAQSVPVAVNSDAQLSVGRHSNTDASFGFYNEVTATYRHCEAYATYPSAFKKLITFGHAKPTIDVEACSADPSTVYLVKKHHNLTTDAGKDFIKAQVSGTATTANCIYIAVGTSAVTPAAGDTTLTGEVTTNGLQRASGTYAAVSTGTFTLTKTFTATGPVSNVQAAAVFTAASSGTMCFEVGSLGPTTLANTDTLQVQWSGTIN